MFVEEIFGDYAAFAPIIIMLISALILPAVHFAGKRHTVTWAVALVLAVVSMAVNAYMLVDGFTGTTLGVYEYDAYTGVMLLLFQIVLFLAILVSNASTETTRLHVGAYYALLTGATTGMMFVAGSSDLLTIFVGVELIERFEPILYDEGDCYARCKVRVDEVVQSIGLIRKALGNLPEGEWRVPVKGNPPAGQFAFRVEQPRGEAYYYVKGNGTKFLDRARVRTPTNINIPAMTRMLQGCGMQDVSMIIITIDPCISCTER